MTTLLFSPLLGWSIVWITAGATLALAALGLWRQQPSWPLRSLGLGLICLTLANPSWQSAREEALSDIVVLVVDESASQTLGTRAQMTQTARESLSERLSALPNVDLRLVSLGDDASGGTLLMTALARSLAEIPAERLAAIFLLTDGQIHDLAQTPALLAPTHLLLTDHPSDWDRRLIVKNAPAFAILGEPFALRLQIADEGRDQSEVVPLSISIDGGAPMDFTVPTGRDIELPLTLTKSGANVLHFSTPEAEAELTTRNNEAVVQINGVRDRLQVLLVSGEPHAGERAWRNLLKSDPSVDLVHFTILRPADKIDNTPSEELALIAFPTRELFSERIEDFDLIIFDRVTRLSLVSNEYLQNIVRFVERGGAILLSSGPEFAEADSVYRTPLAQILPARPTTEVIEKAFRPQITALGKGHPVTMGLDEALPKDAAGTPLWGQWLRMAASVAAPEADVLLTGAEDEPLLLLNRIGEGRIAMLTSDQSWLWARGYDGGGPHVELLRRLSHWLMREPDLEEEALWAETTTTGLRLIRRTMAENAPPLTLTGPDGSQEMLTLERSGPGRFEREVQRETMGLYRLNDETFEAVIALGPPSPREFEATLATPELIAPLSTPTGGGIFSLREGLPDLRRVAMERSAAGPTWAGIQERGVTRILELETRPLLPAWLGLLFAAAAILAAWLREGGKRPAR